MPNLIFLVYALNSKESSTIEAHMKCVNHFQTIQTISENFEDFLKNYHVLLVCFFQQFFKR